RERGHLHADAGTRRHAAPHGAGRVPAGPRQRPLRPGRQLRLAEIPGQPRTGPGEAVMKPVSRYHWSIVLLHWLLAFYIIATLAGGFLIMAPMANTDPEKKRVLMFHMSFGMAIAGVMLLRLVIRLLTARPAEATTGHAALDRVVPYAHYAFYVLIVLQAAT